MAEHQDSTSIRLEKLAKLREQGVNPFPYRFAFTHRAEQLHKEGDALAAAGTEVSLAGRLMAVRRQGKTAFAHVKDNHHRLQIYIRQDEVGPEAFERFELVDLGDYLGVTGQMMRTKTGEITLRARSYEVLSKAIRPLPIPKVEEHDGQKVVHQQVKDVEFRYRQRYADLALNDEVAQVFRRRTRIIHEVRGYLLDHDFLEVETPVLQTVYGGASATPFTTHHKALDLPLFMRVATELYLKRLVAGGFDRVFEIGKNFRNEGVDRSHNPEFTMVEFYQAYADYTDMMVHFEAIWERAALAVHGKTQFEYQGVMLDVKRPWKRFTMNEAIQVHTGLDVSKHRTSTDLIAAARALPSPSPSSGKLFNLASSTPRGLVIAAIFEDFVEHKLQQPTFIIDFPKETTPLCKAHRMDPDLVERFEPYIMGFEMGNAYSELNDPQVQKALFEEQVTLRKGGDLEAHPFDADFVRAMEYGMPPMGGVGIGLDRMIMLLTNQHSLRDVLFFPTMRPEQE